MGANDPQGSGQFGPWGLVWQDICRGPLHIVTVQTKYISSGLHGFREEDFFFSFPFVSLWELMTPGAWPVWAPGLDWQDLRMGPLNIATY